MNTDSTAIAKLEWIYGEVASARPVRDSPMPVKRPRAQNQWKRTREELVKQILNKLNCTKNNKLRNTTKSKTTPSYTKLTKLKLEKLDLTLN